MEKKINVLIVDDSAVARQTIKEVLSSDPAIGDIVTAPDPIIAFKKIEKDVPDVIILDVEMPRMDGITFLQKIMSQHPMPVIMCSALTEKGCETTLKALEYGAVDIITKPKVGVKLFFKESQILLCDSVKAAARARIKHVSPGAMPRQVEKKLTADVVLPPPTGKAMIRTTERIVAVGASTGGTEALRIFLEELPLDCPGVVIVQHMPEHFTRAFADRLNTLCRIEVKEAADGDSVLRGRALIGPGNRHILLKRSGARYFVEVRDGPLVCRHRPSVDVLFRSAARYAGSNAVGVIMTGMGDDGARGMLEMKEAGAATIAQDEASSVVFGMPNEAIKRNAVDRILPLGSIAGAVLRECLR
ncbi:MAG: chemotaxis response regulator protein-glutamate methylesterase [Desulfobacteraceae bacterium IS3]|nr:MAG: chemotaxis response regulator protein-glutamate methylesterase [Desulfobacteraceae bacterium IS3]